jgi:saccharopine dehydrogenase-like NADP-dependent oxidoreductase
MRAAVLGAGGAAGTQIVRDLAGSEEFDALSLLDLDGAAARAVASEHGLGKATGAAVDGVDRQALTLALEGHQLLVNAASHRVTVEAMDAALAAGCNYMDIGSSEDVRAGQVALGRAFEEAGLVAILGCPTAAATAQLFARGGLGPVMGVIEDGG